ncbi:MAG: 5-(carboxyamino)imidazole ribonucleotide mutase [Candidatus Omnitrophota bacterium]|nr:5-(carboxyamino)imidazole ribonucleotide mutase [Candidatus Omnitrophota bacterium]
MPNVEVAIMMGSKSDLPVMEESAKILKEFGVSCELKVLSAHRTPKETAAYAEKFRSNGGKVFICGAGVSAALAGFVAAHTSLPVIGVPIDSSPLNGMDALLSTVQMPPGVPVGCVSIGKAGAKNAAFLALRILGVADKTMAQKLDHYNEEQRKAALNTDLN